MCTLCVEVIRERIKIKDAIESMREGIRAGAKMDEHQKEIIHFDQMGNEKKVEELIKAGYRKERWL